MASIFTEGQKEKLNKKIDVNRIEKEYREREEELELEKGDGFAIFLSAIVVFGPVVLIAIGLFFLFSYLAVIL